MLNRSIEATVMAMTLAALALGQPSTAPAAFDVADVHTSAPGAKQGTLSFRDGRFEAHGISPLRLITLVYGAADDRVFGGPAWLGDDRYDIIAQAVISSRGDSAKPMLRALLADRFKLVAHTEDRPEPIYALLPGKRLQLKPKAEAGNSQCKRIDGDGYYGATCQNVTFASLAELLPSMAPNNFNHPVVDKTGLELKIKEKLRASR